MYVFIINLFGESYIVFSIFIAYQVYKYEMRIFFQKNTLNSEEW